MLSVAEQTDLLRDLSRTQTVIPLVNRNVDLGQLPRCGVIVSSEYTRGKIRIWLGNVFAGIDPNCEKLEFESTNELFSEWEID